MQEEPGNEHLGEGGMVSILYLRCGPPDEDGPSPNHDEVSILYLRCGVSAEEMRRIIQSILGFNSLFEMRIAPRREVRQRRHSVSILYLRCHRGDGPTPGADA